LVLVKEGVKLEDGKHLNAYDLQNNSTVSVWIGNEKTPEELEMMNLAEGASGLEIQAPPSYRQLTEELKVSPVIRQTLNG
jgi:hypothetical protein